MQPVNARIALLSQGAGDVIADVIERIGGGPDLLDLGAGGIQFRPLQCGLPYLVLCYGECGRRKSCKCMCALRSSRMPASTVSSIRPRPIASAGR